MHEHVGSALQSAQSGRRRMRLKDHQGVSDGGRGDVGNAHETSHSPLLFSTVYISWIQLFCVVMIFAIPFETCFETDNFIIFYLHPNVWNLVIQ
jgi:hypothetical protein